jgi:hypothetical protein
LFFISDDLGGHIADESVIISSEHSSLESSVKQGPAVRAAILVNLARCSAVRGANASYDVDTDDDVDDAFAVE